MKNVFVLIYCMIFCTACTPGKVKYFCEAHHVDGKQCPNVLEDISQGVLHHTRGESEKAIEYFNKVNNVTSSLPVQFFLAENYFDLGKYNVAEAYYDKVIEAKVLDGKNFRALFARSCQHKAEILCLQKKHSKAFSFFQLAIDHEDDPVEKAKKEKALKKLGDEFTADW